MNKQAGLFRFIIGIIILLVIFYLFHSQIIDFIKYILAYKP